MCEEFFNLFGECESPVRPQNQTEFLNTEIIQFIVTLLLNKSSRPNGRPVRSFLLSTLSKIYFGENMPEIVSME